jgi:hypothetical protein
MTYNVRTVNILPGGNEARMAKLTPKKPQLYLSNGQSAPEWKPRANDNSPALPTGNDDSPGLSRLWVERRAGEPHPEPDPLTHRLYDRGLLHASFSLRVANQGGLPQRYREQIEAHGWIVTRWTVDERDSYFEGVIPDEQIVEPTLRDVFNGLRGQIGIVSAALNIEQDLLDRPLSLWPEVLRNSDGDDLEEWDEYSDE